MDVIFSGYYFFFLRMEGVVLDSNLPCTTYIIGSIVGCDKREEWRILSYVFSMAGLLTSGLGCSLC